MSADDFKMTIERAPDHLLITVVGALNETSVLELPGEVATPIRINGEGITRINSLGVSAWIRFMNSLKTLGVPVGVRMSVAMASQASMISNFVEGASIESFAAPYYCPACENTEEPVFAFNDEVPETRPCSQCKQSMEFDDEIDSFLSFRRAV